MSIMKIRPDAESPWEGIPALVGPGVAAGGTTGQALKKKSGADYDTEWGDLPTLANLGAAALSILAPEYSAASTYALGVFCTYDNKFYECTSAIGTPEAWTAGHWTERTVGDVLAALKTLLDGKQAAATITENTNAAPALGTLANNTEYRCTHSTPTDAPTMTIASIAANTTEFACNVIYKAEASEPSAPAVTNNSGKTIKYQGDDVSSGTFTPVAGTVYRLGWVWDGIYLNCYIKGV